MHIYKMFTSFEPTDNAKTTISPSVSDIMNIDVQEVQVVNIIFSHWVLLVESILFDLHTFLRLLFLS